MELNELRKNMLISEKLPFKPNIKDLEDIKIGTNCDYLINVKSVVLKDEIGSFPTSPNVGSSKKLMRPRVE